MKKLGYLVALLLSLASPALAQGPAGLIVGQTPVIGGAPGQCLDILSGGRLGATTCGTGGSGVDSFSAGITGLTPNSATTGNVVLGGLLSATNGGTGVDNTGKSITLGGVLTTQGAFTTTLTVTGNTSVTLPTSGTLATVGATTSSFSGGTTGLTPSSPVTGAIVLSGLLGSTNGGTGVNNSGRTITLGGSLVTQNALTLPTTVASLAANTFTGLQNFNAAFTIFLTDLTKTQITTQITSLSGGVIPIETRLIIGGSGDGTADGRMERRIVQVTGANDIDRTYGLYNGAENLASAGTQTQMYGLHVYDGIRRQGSIATSDIVFAHAYIRGDGPGSMAATGNLSRVNIFSAGASAFDLTVGTPDTGIIDVITGLFVGEIGSDIGRVNTVREVWLGDTRGAVEVSGIYSEITDQDPNKWFINAVGNAASKFTGPVTFTTTDTIKAFGTAAAGNILANRIIMGFTGDPGGTTDFRTLTNLTNALGGNSIASVTGTVNQVTINTTGGTVALANSINGFVELLGDTPVTKAQTSNLLFLLSTGAGTATEGTVYYGAGRRLSGTGTVGTMRVFQADDSGGVQVTGSAIGFDANSFSAITGGGVVASFRTAQSSGTNTFAFLSTGNAPSQFGGLVSAANLQQTSPQVFGAAGNGSTNDYTAFVNFYASSVATKVVPAGTYALNTQWVPPKQVVSYTMAPGAVFGGGTASLTPVDWSSVIEFQVGPVWTSNLYFQQFDSTFNGYGNIFSAAFQAENIGATAPTVALFAHGKAGAGSAGNVWGANIVATSSVNGSTLFGLEVNLAQGVNAGYTFTSAIGVYIASAGFSATTAGMLIQSNTAAAQWDKAIWFHNRTGVSAAATTYLLFSDANDMAIAAGMDFRATKFTSIDIGTQNFQVIPAAAGAATANFLQVQGAATTVNPVFTCTGTDTNVGCIWNTKGTGVHNMEANGVTQMIIGNTNAADSVQIQAGTGFGLITSRGSSSVSSVLLRGKSTGGVILQDGGGTTHFSVSTAGSVVAGNLGVGAQSTPTSVLDLIPTISLASWTTTGPGIAVKASTMTDTTGTGTVATRVAHSIATPTMASSSAVTLTEATTLYIASAPSAGTNTTITKGYALHVGAGDSLFGGAVTTATTLATGAPAGSTAGLWKMGALQTGAVVLDTTRSVYVDIGGTVYHLMVSQ